MKVIIHTDGSGINRKDKWNSGHGGCGVVMDYGDNHAQHHFGIFKNTTSARMEIFAIIKSLDLVEPGFEIEIRTDNQYCQKTISLQWYETWIMRGEHRKLSTDKSAKKNMDLWLRFKKLYDKHIAGGSIIHLVWVKGHNNHKGNELADKLAYKGRTNKNNIVNDDRNGIYSI